jgi:hypothetical protein
MQGMCTLCTTFFIHCSNFHNEFNQDVINVVKCPLKVCCMNWNQIGWIGNAMEQRM